ncbi:MAG TPA: ABC transporter substrate-binding protein [Dehalococcoidia bacterium]|nr:ABC transporter substrate-binding protein [Dehalococcoidia bacterium]
MGESYWSATIISKRLSRRRAIVSAGAISAAAASLSLVGCGGGSGGDSEAARLVVKPVDATSKAVKGGILKSQKTSDAQHFDPLSGGSSQIFDHSSHVYSRLLQYKVGTPDKRATGELSGDAATSWEFSPDHLTLTMKLRPNMKFDARAPTNGRLLDSDDVAWSAKRAESTSTSKGDLFTTASPTAPIQSWQTPDKSTVIWKFANPFSAALKLFTHGWYIPILPREADDKFDPRRDMRGSGAWINTSYQPSLGWEYKRNPDWYDADKRPFLDGINYPIVSENAQAIAQLKNKGLWYYTPPPESVITIKKETPGINLYLGSTILPGNPTPDIFTSRGTISQALNFSKRDNSPFTDERVRRAASMLIDRDAWIDTIYNTSGLRQDGLEARSEWNNYIGASWGKPRWIDPKDQKDLGDGAKYFQHAPEEAAKLLRAAGKFGVEQEFTYHAGRGGFGGTTYVRECEITIDMLSSGGHFKLKPNVVDYQSVITAKYTFTKGDWDGITFQPVAGYPDLDLLLWASFHPSGRNSWVAKPIPKVTELMEKHRREFDEDKRVELVRDIQKEMSLQMPFLPRMGIGQDYTLAWPFLANYQVHDTYPAGNNYSQEVLTQYWYDKSKDTA